MAGAWGLFAGSALLVGAALGWWARLPARLVAGVMAFGAGVLVSALAFELLDEALKRGGFAATATGFLAGALVYTAANLLLARLGGKHRKRSGDRQPSEAQAPGSGLAIAVGALIDGIPESIAIGLGLLAGGRVSAATVAAVFLSNIPEGLSSSAGVRAAGRSRRYVFSVWLAIATLSGLASLAGYSVFGHFGPFAVSATTAVAAGGILAMVADTMIPEAFENAHGATGLVTVLGFLASFALSKLGG